MKYPTSFLLFIGTPIVVLIICGVGIFFSSPAHAQLRADKDQLILEVEEEFDEMEEEDFAEEDEEIEIPRPSVNEVYQFLKRKFPEAYKELQLAQAEDPVEDFMDALDRATNFVVDYLQIAHDDQRAADLFLEIQKAELKAIATADQYFEAESTTQRKRLIQQLQFHVKDLVEAQLKEQEHELNILKNEVLQIEKFLAERKKNKSLLIQEILQDFLAEEYESDEDEDDEFDDDEDEDDLEFDDGDE